MRRTLASVVILLFSVPLFAQTSIWFDGTFNEAMTRAEKNGKLLIIDFYSDG